MNLALFIGDIIQSYETEAINELRKLTKSRGHRLDIFANCCVLAGDYLHVVGLKKVFYLSDLDKYDGIILADDTLHNYEMNKDLRTLLQEKAKCPVVCLRNSVDGCYNVVFDDCYEMYLMTKHLIEVHNCRDLGFVTGTFDLNDSTNRLNGFKMAMADAGIPINREEDIFNGNYWSNQGDETAEFFMKRKKGLPEAIVCSNDYMAIALIDSLKKLGIKCPEDVLITGLDNIPEGSENIPTLTTIEFNMETMVKTAVGMLENIAIRKIEQPKMIAIKGKGIFRSSCGCLNMRDVMFQNYKAVRGIIAEEYNNSIQCVSMNMDFGVILEFEDCIERMLQLLRDSGKYKRAFVVLKDCLYAEQLPDGRINIYGNSNDPEYKASDKYPISEFRDKLLEDETNVFLTINYQDELYGYVVLQLAEDKDNYFDVVTTQILILVGNTLKKLELLSYQGELRTIKKLYQQDSMTGLYNRRGFENHIRNLYQSDYLTDSGQNIRVIISSIDMDRLKYINDNFGHYEGDRAIKAVADCLVETLHEDEFAARIGGDEFSAIILLKEGEDMYEFRQRMYAAAKRKSMLFPQYPFSISVGLAEVPDYRHVLESMKMADTDMYKEKQLHHQDV